jgi:putative transposase
MEKRKVCEVLGAKKLARMISSPHERINHKRVARILRQNNMSVRRKKRRRYRMTNLERLPIPSNASAREGVWSIDFMCSRKASSFRYMILNMVVITMRNCPGIIVERSFTSQDVTENLSEAFKTHGKPKGLITDNGAEFTATNFRVWCRRNNITHYLTNKSSPSENSFVESFNSCVRREVLDETDFTNISELRRTLENWRLFYNEQRPHGSLGYLSPDQYVMVQQNRK